MFAPINPGLYDAVRDTWAHVITLFRVEEVDPNSEAFLSRFPIFILEELGEEEHQDPTIVSLRERLARAAFADTFRARIEEAIAIFCSNPGSDTPQAHFYRMVDDFLNYAMPLSVGLPDESAQFDALYGRFESDLFTDSYTLNVIAPLENFTDHQGRFRNGHASLCFAWANLFPHASYNSAPLRKRALRYLELMNTPIYGGGGVKHKNGFFFLLEYQETRRKERGELAEAYKRAEEVTRKAVLTARLLTFQPVYAQCIGLRVLSQYAGGGRGMILWNPRDEWIDERADADLQSCAESFQKLLPYVLSAPAASIEIVFLKIDDALRRRRKASRPFPARSARADIDRLLDYCQALEAILPFRGDQIPSYAAELLRTNGPTAGAIATDTYDFLKDM